MPVVLITGGGRGIGAAVARAAARRGYDVCLLWHRDEASAAEVCGELVRIGVRALAVQADVAVEDEVVAAFARCDAELGSPDALVNNAGILVAQQRVEAMSAQRIARILAVNVGGTILCAREAVRRMSTQRGGRGGAIVNVSSVAARLGAPGEYVDYAASKGAVDTFTVGLAQEVAGEGIRVNAVRPGFIKTDIHAAGGEPGRIERVAPSVPMRRGGEPEEVADAIMWLLSDDASFVTGSVLDVAGGR